MHPNNEQKQPQPPRNPVIHSMTRRYKHLDYQAARHCFMLTLRVEEHAPLFGSIMPPAAPAARTAATPLAAIHRGASATPTATVALTPLGEAVRAAWLALPATYPELCIYEDDFVVMPEHFHGLLFVTQRLRQHLSRIVAHFKADCNNAYRYLLTQGATRPVGQGRQWLAAYQEADAATQAAMRQWLQERQLPPAARGEQPTPAAMNRGAEAKPPFQITRPGSHPKVGLLFAINYTDTLAIGPDQIETKRQYIRNNPQSRWLRSSNTDWLQPKRASLDTGLTAAALQRYLRSVCRPTQATPEALAAITARLIPFAAIHRGAQEPPPARGDMPTLRCDTYGNRALLAERLLPVVCHQRDKARFAEQKARCMEAAAQGAVLVSACIAPGEQDIIDTAIANGYTVVRIVDNGFPEIYHPSTAQTELCSQGRLLLVSPWSYQYRHQDESVTVVFCKTMNCVAQAICHLKDDWWKQ